MLIYLFSGVLSFAIIAAATWGYGVLLALFFAAVGASAVAGTVAVVRGLRRPRRAAAAQVIRQARTSLAD